MNLEVTLIADATVLTADDRREALIRQRQAEIGELGHTIPESSDAFLLRRLDEARQEITVLRAGAELLAQRLATHLSPGETV